MTRSAARNPTSWLVGLGLVLLAAVLYWISNPEHFNLYNHFVWQADAFLQGRAWFPYPVPDGGDIPPNWWFQDVYPLTLPDGTPDGRVLLPFPPLPAIVLLPFVAIWGLATDQEAVALGLGALGVGLAWWMLGGLRLRATVRALTTAVFATGTVWWWATAVGSTWYLAHLVAADIALVAVGVALRHDPEAATQRIAEERRGLAGGLQAAAWPLDRSQILVGFLLGLAVTARLPLIFAAPFFILVGGGGSGARRLLSAAVGGVLPVAALLVYTFVTTGSVLHPGYDFQYQLEAEGYETLGYNAEWSVEDVRYIPQNLGIMVGALPVIAPDVLPDTLGVGPVVPLCSAPDAARSLFDVDCPLAVPIDLGTSVLLSAPGLLLSLLALRRHGLARLGLATVAAVVLVATFNLAHFSQGWVQWGYRFSLDFLPFLLPMVALGAARPSDGRVRVLAVVLLLAGGFINLWGVTWGQLLAW
ncbi:MAG TPA: hypothetical protein VES19_09825 [Candidatus Limnocylindrales bacterium]|nr:hypothetical protein [Candidatus Limnocylindrales bacterium]